MLLMMRFYGSASQTALVLASFIVLAKAFAFHEFTYTDKLFNM